MLKGIDVSHHNGAIDWKRVKAAGIDFAMLRTGFGWDNDSQIDRRLRENVRGCEENGLPYGLYHYSYAMDPQQAAKEAEFFLRITEGMHPLCPVAFDFEEKKQLQLAPAEQLAIIEAFLGKIEAAGLFGALYMSAAPLERLYLTAPERVGHFESWVAHVDTDKPAFSGKTGMWQYSWKGQIEGISGNVDLDIAYRDYPALLGAKKPAGAGASFCIELADLLETAAQLMRGLERLVQKAGCPEKS